MPAQLKQPLYFDYHATTPCAPEAVEAMLPYFHDKFGNPHAKSHKNGRAAAAAVETAKEQLAALLNCDAGGLIITSGATEANNTALLGLCPADGRNEILIGALEHPSILASIPALERKGFTVKTIPANKDGFVTAAALRELISEKTRLVTVMAANHEIGTAQPVKDLAAIAHEYGALFHTDAAQCAGKLPLDIRDAEIDMLSLSAHKLYGPCGIGALYVRTTPPLSLEPVLNGGLQQHCRSGTVPLALSVGMGVAADIARTRMAHYTEKLNALVELLLSKLPDDIRINGARTPRIPGSINLLLPSCAAEDVLLDLADDLCLSTGSACKSGSGKPSGVLKAIGLTDEETFRALRISMGRDTTEEDVIFAAEKLAPYCSTDAKKTDRMDAAGLRSA
jgi:cysteine desulfurase